MPIGRRDAECIWFEFMGKFLHSFGLRRCSFVDDTRLTYSAIALCES